MQTKASEDIRTEAGQCLIIDEDLLHCQATIAAEETHSKNLREVEKRLRALTDH